MHLTSSSVLVSEYAAVWDTDSFAVKAHRVGLVKWRRLPETAVMNAITALIKGAREMRLSRYRTCRSCAEKNPPEWLFAEDLCVRCADQQSDTVH